jgi:hypothetical protein
MIKPELTEQKSMILEETIVTILTSYGEQTLMRWIVFSGFTGMTCKN